MTATTVEFKLFGDTVFVSITGSTELHAWTLTDDQRTVLEAIDQLAWGTAGDGVPEAVREAGRTIRAKLDEIPGLRQRLQGGFATALPSYNSLVLRVATPEVEQVPFEVLFDEPSTTFAALDERWSLARLPADCDARPIVATIPPRLRMLAIVAARGIPPDKEVEALRDAIAKVNGLDVDVHLLTNRESGIDIARAAGWTAEYVTGDIAADAIVEQVADFGPQLLHLFCHGTAQPPQVQIGLNNDLAQVDLGAEVLAEMIKGPTALGPWLVTLNCCEGAGAGSDTASLAASLVRAGFPAVIGMRAPVDPDVAHQFCQELYEVVLGRLAELAQLGSAQEPLDWGALLQGPRRRLVTVHGGVASAAARQKEWTMPVLYLGADRFLVRGRPTADLTDDEVTQEIMQLASADAMEHTGAVPPAVANALRAPRLQLLYP